MLLNVGLLCLLLWLCFSYHMILSKDKKSIMLNIYYVLIGSAFFFIEIVLFQVYQNIFLSSSLSFIFILGFLLLSSGIGGFFSRFIKLREAIIFLLPLCIGAIYLPNWLLSLGFQSYLIKSMGIFLVSLTGFYMGVFFPRGLMLAKKMNLKQNIAHFFAINAVAGCFTVILVLYLGIKIGYVYTVTIGLLFYFIATLIYLRLRGTYGPL